MKQITKYFYHDMKTIPYLVTYKDIRRIILKIDNKNRIIVSCPIYTTDKMLNDFLYANVDQILKMKERKESGTKYNPTEGKVSLFGKELKVQIISTTGNEKFKVYNDTIMLYLKSKANFEKVIKRFYKTEAKDYISKRLEELSIKTGLKYKSLNIKWFESKWGHCDSLCNIVISAKLMTQPKDVIDYVLIHELSHTVHHNHSEHFWNLVAYHCPNYREYKKLLKEL